MFTPKENLQQLSKPELAKYFESLFNQLSRTHSHYNTFEHFLDCCINGFCVNYDNETMEYIRKKYSQDERYTFGEMLRVWVAYMDKAVVSDNMFHDFFGTFYENQAMTKKSGFAQYFTPEHICTLMALVVAPEESAKGAADPACGSGRMSLAIHALNHRLFHVVNDLDFTCAKMTALNFLIHGVKGIVTCDDGLFPGTKFKGAFIVNYHTAPFMEFVSDKDQAYAFIHHVMPSNPVAPDQQTDVKTEPVEPKENTTDKKPDIGTQLKLF